jgi:4-hydroxy-2-oxoheptanedioate aldolase
MSALRFTNLLNAPGPVMGTWAQMDTPEAVELLAVSGFDFAIVDTEHTPFGMARAQDLLRAAEAAGLAAAIRVAALDRVQVTKALDCGFSAVVVPGIETAEEVQRLLRWSRFGEGGERGACPCIRAAGQATLDWDAYARRSDAAVLAMPLIETLAAIAAIDRILAVEGLRVVVLGPFDLSVAMGYRGDTTAPEVQAALRGVIAACAKAGVMPILPIFAPDPAPLGQTLRTWQGAGVRLFTIGTDKQIFSMAARSLVAAGRGSDG